MQKIQIQTATQDKDEYNRNAQKIIENIKANDMNLIEATLEYALQVFNSHEPPLRKLLLLRLIKDAIVIKSTKFINKYIQNRPLLTYIANICTHNIGDSNPNRGADLFQGQDPQSSIEFLNLALELVGFLATKFPKDSKGAPTKFKIQYDELIQMGVKFPPQSNLMQPFDPIKDSQQQIQKPLENKKERDEIILQLNKSKETIYSDIEMIHEALDNDSEMTYTNDVLETCRDSMKFMQKSFQNLIINAQQYDGILDEDQLAELYALKDFIEKFQQYYQDYFEKELSSSAYNSLKIQTQAHIQKIQNKDFDYSPQQKQQQQSKLKQYQQSEFQDEDQMQKTNFDKSKLLLQNLHPTVNHFDEEEIKRQQAEESRQAKLRQEQAELEKQRKENERKENERKENERKENERKENERKENERKENERKENERRENERRENERKENERKENQRRENERRENERKENERKENQRRENERKENERRENERKEIERRQYEEQIIQEQYRLEEKKKEQLKLEQIKQEQRKQEELQKLQQQIKQKEIEDYWKNQFQPQNQDNQYMTPTKLGSTVTQYQQIQQQQQSQYLEQQSQQQQQYQQQQLQYQMQSSFQYQKQDNFNNNYIYSNLEQKYQQKQPEKQQNQYEYINSNLQMQKQPYSYVDNTNHIISNIEKKKEFEENFDGLSQSTLTQQFYPLKMNQQIPIKQYYGKFFKYDNTQFEILHSQGLTESQRKRFKLATIKGKAALVNSTQLQIGIKQALQYVPLKQKNYLKLTLYIGNKTQSNFENCKMKFEGDDKQFSMWLKPEKIAEKIEAGQQIQQELIGIYRQYENYKLINVVFSAEWANKQIASNFFLTTTLVSFMDFKDMSLQVFRTKWKQKKASIFRGETFILNPKIVKTGYYLKKIFPKLCEINSYQQFQDQQLENFGDNQAQYFSYKLCGIFELTNVNQNYMIKFIFLPNMQCTIQIIGNNEHLCKQMLNTLNWILGLE